MTDLLYARARMTMSLGFHIVVAAIGVALPLLMVIVEWRSMRSKGNPAEAAEYLELTKRWAKGTAIAGSLGTEGILTLFAYLAAVYLTMEANEPDLVNDFRRRALISSVIAALCAVATFFASRSEAPLLYRGLTTRPWSLILFAVTGACALTAFVALLHRRFQLARAAAIAQVVFVVLGWGAVQAPFLVARDVTVFNAAAPDNILQLLLIVLGVGAVPLSFLLYDLFRVFKNVGETR